jgi:hypothetical protein
MANKMYSREDMRNGMIVSGFSIFCSGLLAYYLRGFLHWFFFAGLIFNILWFIAVYKGYWKIVEAENVADNEPPDYPTWRPRL